ncbi:hypothetical protein [Paludibacterium denitrificans]|uniref:Uncharacterized protein n=1 Tax=Paludibacterium denitrificans TaxID=2675226 RepID=A0A844GFA4_9NEIS|nr:hypothetical protein [Paludibacterium denitrificans]MTD34000.1 hypothetical protein [Paludibacterium denitrificans]
MKLLHIAAITLSVASTIAAAAPRCIDPSVPTKITKLDRDGTFKELKIKFKQDGDLYDVDIIPRARGEIGYFTARDGANVAYQLPIKALPVSLDNLESIHGSQIEVAQISLGTDGKKQVAVVHCDTEHFKSVVEVFSLRNGKWVRLMSDTGQDKVFFRSGEVFIPIGTQGYGVLYRYRNGKLVKLQD